MVRYIKWKPTAELVVQRYSSRKAVLKILDIFRKILEEHYFTKVADFHSAILLKHDHASTDFLKISQRFLNSYL